MNSKFKLIFIATFRFSFVCLCYVILNGITSAGNYIKLTESLAEKVDAD